MTAWQYVAFAVAGLAILTGLVDGARVIRRGAR